MPLMGSEGDGCRQFSTGANRPKGGAIFPEHGGPRLAVRASVPICLGAFKAVSHALSHLLVAFQGK